MTERPILFSAPMVRAILDGSKTQTRRIAKPVKHPDLGNIYAPGTLVLESEPQHVIERACPYGRPGDRLWVRETFGEDYGYCTHEEMPGCPDERWHNAWHYRADGEPDTKQMEAWTGWKPSIHMPRWASRILLEIVAVRVERLQAISEADADAEGCERLDSEREVRDWKLCARCGGTRLHRELRPSGGVIEDVDCRECDTYVKRYKHLWESINGAGSWDANSWVWVVEFKRVTP